MKKIKKFIKRKTLIYKTEVEYGDYTMNHVLGCSHGCLYPCYAFLQKKRFGNVKTYEDWCEPALVENTLELLDVELPKFKDKIQMLHLCFTTDPFMYQYKEVHDMSMTAIKKANDAGIKCSVLTKGILPIELAGLSKENEYGITLITTNEAFRKRMEPGAAPWKKRLVALRALHDAGCKTWVADEQESMIDRYIDRGTMYVLEDGGVKCECIVTDEGNGILEIKNIATEPEFQRNGYAKKMVEYIAEKHKGKYSVLQVGTGDSPLTVPFYEKCGFVKTHSIKNFFIDNYDHPIYECGVKLTDMIYLQRAI